MYLRYLINYFSIQFLFSIMSSKSCPYFPASGLKLPTSKYIFPCLPQTVVGILEVLRAYQEILIIEIDV